MKELPNCKIGVTNTVYHKLRDLKKRGDTFNDVVERLLPTEDAPDTLDKFDAVAEAYKVLSEEV